jgi:hypothetical protein
MKRYSEVLADLLFKDICIFWILLHSSKNQNEDL